MCQGAALAAVNFRPGGEESELTVFWEQIVICNCPRQSYASVVGVMLYTFRAHFEFKTSAVYESVKWGAVVKWIVHCATRRRAVQCDDTGIDGQE